MFHNGEKVVVAVSGGADSVCLLQVLAAARNTLGISLVAVYVDHCLRPLETENEKLLVQTMAGSLNVDFESVDVDVEALVQEKKLSLEHAARELRYAALRKIAVKNDAVTIAVAHNADDQVEEILIRLLRGSGRKGISGMCFVNRDVVRPLLGVTKQDIIAYLYDMDIQFLEDSSNRDLRFLRNRVRNLLIPFLEENFDDQVKPALRKVGENLAEDEVLLEELTDIAWDMVIRKIKWDDASATSRIIIGRKNFISQPGALQRRIVERLLWTIGSRAGYSHIVQVVEAARNGRTGAEIHLSKGLRVGVGKEYVEFRYPKGRSSWRGRLYHR